MINLPEPWSFILGQTLTLDTLYRWVGYPGHYDTFFGLRNEQVRQIYSWHRIMKKKTGKWQKVRKPEEDTSVIISKKEDEGMMSQGIQC